MRPHYSIVTASTQEPIGYQDAADHLRVDCMEDVQYIEGLISVAREYVEDVTGKIGHSTTWLAVAPSWESFMDGHKDHVLRLQRAPLASVTSVQYYAPDAVALTTMSASDYRVITSTEPGAIQQVDDDWPDLHERPDAVQITFVAGLPMGSYIPNAWKHAVKMLVAHLYEERKPVAFSSCQEIPWTLQSLIESQRIGGRFA